MKIKILLLVFLGLILNSLSAADPGTQQLLKALKDNEMTDFYINEYKKMLFFGQIPDAEKGKVWLELAISYREINNEPEMIKAFTKALEYSRDKNFSDTVFSEIALFYLARGKTEQAEIFISRLSGDQAETLGLSLKCLSYLFSGNQNKLTRILIKLKIKPAPLDKIRKLLKKISRIKSTSRSIINLRYFFPGIISFIDLDPYSGAKAILFNYIYLEPLLFKSTLLEKIIALVAVYRYNRNDIIRKSKSLDQKNRIRILTFEQEIFNLITNRNSFENIEKIP